MPEDSDCYLIIEDSDSDRITLEDGDGSLLLEFCEGGMGNGGDFIVRARRRGRR